MRMHMEARAALYHDDHCKVQKQNTFTLLIIACCENPLFGILYMYQ